MKDHRQCPDVRATRRGLAGKNLGSHVVGSANQYRRAGRCRCVRRQTEVGQHQPAILHPEEVVGLEVSPDANPWIDFAGMFKDDPMIDEWKRAMADYRKQVDEDPDYL